ncbi:single-stranded DNA-binding protein [Sanguibacter massiliensis]|uniref:single-stranded DNA-binding protein n=1 Tax=Sanguibacter massiliensis TaxID=1973217 RepID=UPI000C845599|nr:single-stranded DNA-binding protein [Sanguibacter massiliensis]
MSTPITVVGRIGQAELKFTPSGKAVLNGSVAKQKRSRNAAGEWEDSGVDWHRFALWGAKAEAAADVVTKGVLVVLTGDLESRDFETRDGEKRTVWEIRAQEVGVIPTAQRATRTAAPAQDPWAGQASSQEPPW